MAKLERHYQAEGDLAARPPSAALVSMEHVARKTSLLKKQRGMHVQSQRGSSELILKPESFLLLKMISIVSNGSRPHLTFWFCRFGQLLVMASKNEYSMLCFPVAFTGNTL